MEGKKGCKKYEGISKNTVVPVSTSEFVGQGSLELYEASGKRLSHMTVLTFGFYVPVRAH